MSTIRLFSLFKCSIFTSRLLFANLLPNPIEYFKCRDNSRKNKESFITQLKNENWSVLEEIDEPNSA